MQIDKNNVIAVNQATSQGNVPLLSVVVPVYNAEKYLMACVDSILQQTYGNIEIILVNDGSSDTSGEICDILAASHANIHVMHKENGGQASARNLGITIAAGEYITFIDSDDVYGDNRTFEICMEHLLKDAELDIVQFPLQFTDESGNVIDPIMKYREGYIDTQASLSEELSRWMLSTNANTISITTSVCDKIFKRHWVTQTKFRKVFCEDALFLLELVSGTPKILIQNGGRYVYIQHDGSTMNSPRTLQKTIDTVKFFDELYQALRMYSDDLQLQTECVIRMRYILLDLYFNYSRQAFRNLKLKTRRFPLKYISGDSQQKRRLLSAAVFGLKNSVRLNIINTYLNLCMRRLLRLWKG